LLQTISGTIIRTRIEDTPISFFVNNEEDLIQNHHLRGEFYEKEELEIISRYFKSGCFVDIGANIGNHTIFVAKFLKPTRIVCIEPNPEAINILETNIRLNDLSGIVDQRYLGIGLAAASGTADLHQPQVNNLGAMQLLTGNGQIRVAVGDDLLYTEIPDFIKIDVEGMEMDVLKGLEHTISRRSPAMFIEVDNRNRAEFDAWCASHSYSIAQTYRRYSTNENFLITR
jgi:FkbM family methyltransferase